MRSRCHDASVLVIDLGTRVVDGVVTRGGGRRRSRLSERSGSLELALRFARLDGRMTASLHRLLAGSALAAGAVTLGLAAGGVAGMDEELAAATRPPAVEDHLVEYRPDCPARAPGPRAL